MVSFVFCGTMMEIQSRVPWPKKEVSGFRDPLFIWEILQHWDIELWDDSCLNTTGNNHSFDQNGGRRCSDPDAGRMLIFYLAYPTNSYSLLSGRSISVSVPLFLVCSGPHRSISRRMHCSTAWNCMHCVRWSGVRKLYAKLANGGGDFWDEM